jgi:hypothetical protein
MSYSPTEAQLERDEAVFNALDTRDSETLHQLAALYKEEGDDEEAARLLQTARNIDREDNAYDESIGN